MDKNTNDPFDQAMATMSARETVLDKDVQDNLDLQKNEAESQQRNLHTLLNIKVEITMEIGRAKMLISDLLLLGQGSVIELDKIVGDDLNIMVQDKLIGKAEVVISKEKFAGRIKKIANVEERLQILEEQSNSI